MEGRTEMTDLSIVAKSLTPASIHCAYSLIKTHIKQTPLFTCQSLNAIASNPQSCKASVDTSFEGQAPAHPRFRFFFKCENYQRTGAFKVRGAFNALLRLIEDRGEEEVRKRGVVTHSSGNHAQALALAASTLDIPAYVVMPSISTPYKIASTRSYGAKVIFSGFTSTEREAVMVDVQAKTNAILVPSSDDYNVICGQGTIGLELEEQFREAVKQNPTLSAHHRLKSQSWGINAQSAGSGLDAVITPVGGGGLAAGIATYFSNKPTQVFGAEPSFEGADDCRRGLQRGARAPAVKSLTIADGLRTPVGLLNWEVISDHSKVRSVFAVTEVQIKAAMRLLLEHMKMVVEPSAVVGLAICLFNEDFRRLVETESREGWDVGIVLSGGNTTVEAMGKLFG